MAEVIEAPFNHFLGETNRRREPIDVGLPTGPFEVPFFTYANHKIWGATSTMLAELSHRIDMVL